jgi:hypothetical protein
LSKSLATGVLNSYSAPTQQGQQALASMDGGLIKLESKSASIKAISSSIQSSDACSPSSCIALHSSSFSRVCLAGSRHPLSNCFAEACSDDKNGRQRESDEPGAPLLLDGDEAAREGDVVRRRQERNQVSNCASKSHQAHESHKHRERVDRQLVIDACLHRNLKQLSISKVVLFKEGDAPPLPQASVPLEVVESNERTNYAEWFLWVKQQCKGIGLLLSADINLDTGHEFNLWSPSKQQLDEVLVHQQAIEQGLHQSSHGEGEVPQWFLDLGLLSISDNDDPSYGESRELEDSSVGNADITHWNKQHPSRTPARPYSLSLSAPKSWPAQVPIKAARIEPVNDHVFQRNKIYYSRK